MLTIRPILTILVVLLLPIMGLAQNETLRDSSQKSVNDAAATISHVDMQAVERAGSISGDSLNPLQEALEELLNKNESIQAEETELRSELSAIDERLSLNRQRKMDLEEDVRTHAANPSSGAIVFSGTMLTVDDAKVRVSQIMTDISLDSAARGRVRSELDALDAASRTIIQAISHVRMKMNRVVAQSGEQQSFRKTISTSFLFLIGIILMAYFATLYVRSKADAELAASLLNENGLQFMTLFVLIIAIVLFGILGILEAKELAAILSGIAGYVLGRGTIGGNDGKPAKGGSATSTVNIEAPPN